jgi:chemotaxis methyl-accepting protein methylase
MLIDSIAINVSCFFRNPVLFELLGQRVLPEIIDRKLRGGRREIRVWSAGCASGEEAYSLAILLCEALGPDGADWQCLLFATDVDRRVLTVAEEGVYSREKLADCKLGLVDRYFTRRGERYQLDPEVRSLVRLSWDDLTSPTRVSPPQSIFGSFDLVACRNVLIYFSPEAQQRIQERLVRSLAPGGYLVLGEAEHLAEGLRPKCPAVDERNRIYRCSP